jgi:uncharacterized protein
MYDYFTSLNGQSHARSESSNQNKWKNLLYAFGWNIRKRGDGKTAFDDTVGQISGVWVAGRKASPEAGLLVYIMVDDISAAIEKVIANAGKIVQAVGMDAPELTARFSDPAGNILGLYQEPPKKNK